MNIAHIMGNYERLSSPSRLRMREDGGTIYFDHGGQTVSLTLTEEQADELVSLIAGIAARKGFREMEDA